MENRISLLIDQLGKGDNVFEQFAIEFENSQIEGVFDSSTKELQIIIESIERRLQDLSERINAKNEYTENIYSYTIQRSKEILSIWLPAFSLRRSNPTISIIFADELHTLYKYLDIRNIEQKSLEEVQKDFDSIFKISPHEVQLFRQKAQSFDYHKMQLPDLNLFTVNIVNDLMKIVTYKSAYNNTYYHALLSNNANELIKEESDPENIIYTGQLKLWIDTDDAAEANKFMYIITSVLSNIEGVDLKIEEAGKGSYWQKIGLKIKGWFAKEETKQVFQKGIKAAESYALDRHIEPIEKTKAEKEKTQEEIKRLMSESDTQKLHKIKIAKEEAELESIKLANMGKKLELINKLSTALEGGLLQVDSDFRIELEGLLIAKQEEGKITIGNPDGIDNKLNKSKNKDQN